jgi:hypothetical protein
MIDWDARFSALPDAEKDKIALLRLLNAVMGVFNLSFVMRMKTHFR